MSKQTFQVSVEFLANINDLQKKVQDATAAIAKIGSTSGGTQVQKQFDQLSQTISNLATKAKQPITNQGEFTKLVNEVGKTETAYNNLISSIERMKSVTDSKKLELLPADQQQKIRAASDAIKAYEEKVRSLEGSVKTLSRAQEKANEAADNQAALQKTFNSLKTQVANAEKEYKKLEAAAKNVTNAQKEYDTLFYKAGSKRAGQRKEGITDEQVASAALKLKEAKTAADELKGSYDNIADAANQAGRVFNNLSNKKITVGQDLTAAAEQARRLKEEAATLETKLNSTSGVQLKQAFEELRTRAEELGIKVSDIGKEASAGNINLLTERLQNLRTQGLEQVSASIDRTSNSIKGNLDPALQNLRGNTENARGSWESFDRTMRDTSALKSRIGYFFSLTNSVQLARRALQSAFRTIKELDAVMTETAVVTEFSVGDMWNKLPEYAAAASKLGSSIKDVYAATTLYYQQGLETNEAMALGVETMKMARIAGMESAEATEAMTAALRGFNMELNETSATRVNDVYSQLAANTAANTEQIATAMSKTASIAASANMEFETTAALLAQIIETTQEAPETAGTALKTIIARFSEVKELQSKGLSSGEDEEGEVIDVNRISKALSSVGISMSGFFAGTEGLDSILLKLAEKWDTLDFTTQRYIATMAAGSRQQSRFIAMMSDYGRTTELVGMANNSAGASQKQFNKTMESLEAKLNRLKVAWDQFTMGITNSSIIKAGVDVLTGLLNAVNGLLGKMPGLIKSFASLAVVFGSLKLGGLAVGAAIKGISGVMAKGLIGAGVEAGVIKQSAELGTKAGATAAASTAASVNNPAASAALFKSYNLLLFRVQSALPPVTIKTALAPGSSAAVKSLWAEVNRLKMEEKQVAATYGKMSPQYREIRKQRLLAAQAAQAARKANTSETLSIEGTTIAISKEMAAKIKEGTITKTQLALLGPEAAARVSNALAAGTEEKEIRELAWAKQTEQNLQKGGIVGFLTEIGLRVMGITTIGAEKKSLGGLIKEKWAEFSARMANNSAMLAGLGIVLAIIAAVTLLIVGIVKLVQAYKKGAGFEEKLADINSQLQEMSAAAQEAADKMKAITEDREELKNMSKDLSNLTKGTKEWKSQLLAVNGQVMELINTYPDLAKYISRTANGEMIISDEGWDYIYNQQNAAYDFAISGQVGGNLRKNSLEKDKAFYEVQTELYQRQADYEEFTSSKEGHTGAMFVGGGAGLLGGAIAGAEIGGMAGTAITPGWGTVIGGGVGLLGGALLGLAGINIADWLNNEDKQYKDATGGLNKQDYQEFVAKAAEQGYGYKDEAQLQALFEEMGLDNKADFSSVYDKIAELGYDFEELGIATAQLKEAEQAYIETLVSNAADEAGTSEEFREQTVELVSEIQEGATDEIEKEVARLADEAGKDGVTEGQKEEYAKLAGITVDEVNKKLKEESLSAKTIQTALATEKVQSNAKQKTKYVDAELNRLANKTEGLDVTSLLNILSKDGRSVKGADLSDFLSKTRNSGLEDFENEEQRKKAVEDYLASFGTSLQQLGMTNEDDWRIIWENLTEGSADFLAAQEKAKLIGSEVKIDEDLGGGVAKAFVDKVEETMNQGGIGGKEVYEKAMSMTGELSAEEAQKFVEVLNEIDWSNTDSIKSLSDRLEDLDISFGDAGKGVEELEGKIIDFANSALDITLDEKYDLNKLMSSVKQKTDSGSKIFTKDELKVFDPEIQKDFITYDGENYIYVGDLDASELYTNAKSRTKYVSGEQEKLGAKKTLLGAEQTTGTYTKVKTGDVNTSGNIYNYGDTVARGRGPNEPTGTTTTEGWKEYYYKYGEFIPNLGQWTTDPEKLKNGIYNSTDTINGDFKTTLENNTYGDAIAFSPDDQYFNKILYLSQMGIRDDNAPGADQSLLTWHSWYQNLSDEKKQYYSSLALAMNQKYGASALTGKNPFEGDLTVDQGDNQIVLWTFTKDTEGNVIGKSGTGERTTTTEAFEANELDLLTDISMGKYTTEDQASRAGNQNAKTLSNETIAELYKKYVPEGTETDPAKQLEALQLKIGRMTFDANSFNTDDLYPAMSQYDGQQLYAATSSVIQEERDAATNTIAALAESYDGINGKVEAWKEKNVEILKDLTNADLLLKAMAIDTARQEENFKNLDKVIDEATEALEKGPEAGGEYYEALENIASAMETAFGVDVSTDNVEDWIPYLKKLANGGEDAADAYKYLTEQMLNMIVAKAIANGATEEVQTALAAFVQYIQENPLKPGEIIDTESIIETLGLTGSAWTALKTYINANPLMGKIYIDSETGEERYTGFDFSAFFANLTTPKATTPNKYENSYDKFYNTYERINALIREREKLERRYDKLLQRRGTTVQELVNLSKQQLSLLDEERAKQEYLEQGKLKELEDYAAKNSRYAKYATFDKTTGQVSIDWDAINRISNGDYGQKVDDYISKLEELRDQWQEAQDALEEIEDTVKELYEQGKDEYFDLESRLKDALIGQRQKEIDKLSEINDSINDANSKLLDSMQEQIDAYRQARDNEKTEQELSDKQRRLAYLSQDTSGANAMEILQLQKEIEEGQESYTDQLIDQKISELQKQNDQAAEQRQQQIDLLQAQLTQDETTGAIWDSVYDIMDKSVDENGLKIGSEAWKLLMEQEEYPTLSNLEKLQWAQDLQQLAITVAEWLSLKNTTKALLTTGELAKGQQIEFTTADNKILTGTLGENGAIMVDGMEYTGVTRDYRGNYSTTENFKAKPVEPPKEENPNKIPKDALARGIANSIWFAGGGWGNGSARFSRIAEFGLDSGLVQKYINQIANGKRISYDGSLSDYAYATLKNKGVVAYKAGGLADFTGPAWLDGTKSKPEYILNADQTKAFFTLVDVLSGLGLGSSNSTEKTGDISYDVDINVESIGSDYDVEQLANKVKSLIKDDAMYRNNNAISITR